MRSLRAGPGARAAIGKARLVRLMACVSMLPVIASGEIYKWVDDAGRVHYGDAEPRHHNSRIIETQPPPPPDDVLRSRSRLNGLKQTGQPREDDRDRKAREQEEAQHEALRKERCRHARRSVNVLEMERPVYDLDEQGERVFIEDNDRARRIKRLREVIRTNCP